MISAFRWQHLLLGLLGCGLGAFYVHWTWQGGLVGLVGDDAIYLLMADNFSPYYPSLNAAADFIVGYTRFPPLYPLLLALLGGSSEHLIVAHLLTTTFLLLALVVYFLWLRQRSLSIVPASILVLLFALLPSTLRFSINLWSEHLYLLLTLLVLWLSGKAQNERDWLLVALLIGMVCLTRSIGVTLLAASLIYAWLYKIPRFWLFAGVAIVPSVAWWGVMQLHQPEESYSELLQMRYAEGLMQGLWWQLQHNSKALWAAWVSSFSLQPADWRAIGLLLMAIVSVAVRVYQKQLDGFYVLVYLAVIGAWPNVDHGNRFLFVILPIVMGQIGTVGYCTVRTMQGYKSLWVWLYPVILASLILPASLLLIPRVWLASLPENLAGQQRTIVWLMQPSAAQALNNLAIFKSLQQGFKAAGAHIPPTDCVLVVHPEWFMVNAKRLAFAPPFDYIPEPVFNRRMKKCGYALIVWANTHPYFPSGYPAQRIAVSGHIVYEAPLAGSDALMVATLVRLD